MAKRRKSTKRSSKANSRQANKPASKKKSKRKLTTCQKSKSVTAPSLPTVKHLFAVSRNKCAFPDCPTAMVDRVSSSVLGQICHIKGEKPGSARFDEKQQDAERHAFENLILLCGSHHKIIDDDETTYTVRRLRKMKTDHENPRGRMKLSDLQADQMLAGISGNVVADGSIITSENQTGGQIAHVINNYGESLDDNVTIDASLSVDGGLPMIERFGCPGIVLTIVCRSKRPAKIRNAMLCKEGRGFLKKFATAFGTEFPHSPPPGHETETLYVEFEQISTPNASEGYVLERDDVCRFFLPMAIGGLGLFFARPSESVTIRSEFFDGSERVLLQGEQVQDLLRSLIQTYGKRSWNKKGTGKIGLRVSSTEPPDIHVSAIGTTNYQSLQLVDPSELSQADLELGTSVSCRPLIICGREGLATIGLAVVKPETQPIEANDISVTLVGFRTDTKHINVPFAVAHSEESPSDARVFFLPFEQLSNVIQLVQSKDASSYGISIHSGKRELRVLPGELVQAGVVQILEMAKTSKPAEQSQATRATRKTPKKKGAKRKKK